MRTSKRLAGIVIASALAWVGCVSSHQGDPEVDASVPPADAHVGIDAHVPGSDAHADMDAFVPLECLAEGETGCASAGRACCEGTYCQLGAYVVEYDMCVVQSADGEACNYDTDCVSGHCDSSLCRAAECAAEGEECFAASDCCTGFCPSEFSYGLSVCMLPLPAGEHCYSNAWCASGACNEGLCL